MHTYLIWDEQAVAAHEGVTFGLNVAAKHAENPVLLPGEPHQWDSLQATWPGTVLYSPGERKFRCWYSGLDAMQTPERRWLPGYAESDDGVHWVKPELGQVAYLDRPSNQLAPGWETWVLSVVFENPASDAPPSQRFGSYWLEYRQVQHPQGRPTSEKIKSLAWSPDGLTWTRAGVCYEATADNPFGFQDISQLLADPEDPDPAYQVKGYAQIMAPRAWDGRKVRQIGLVHGEEVERVHDAPEPVVLAPVEGIDEELHFASVKRIGGAHLMLFESDRFSRNPIHGDLRLAVSDDGRSRRADRTFRRIHPRQALVTTGPKGMWDENLLVTSTAAIQDVGDEHYVYYFGCPNVYNSWPAAYAVTGARRGSLLYPSYMGLAVVPRHRFAYAEGPGSVTTHPLDLRGGDLWVNAEGQGIILRAHSAGGEVSANGRLGEERRQTVYRRVVWDAAPAGASSVAFTLGAGARLFGYEVGGNPRGDRGPSLVRKRSVA